MADISLHLPSIFPTDGPITTSEEIRYNTFVTDDSSVNDGIVEETEYTLNKAPVTSITEVTGISDGKSVSFEESVDYKLSDDLSSIIWLENSDSTRPDAGTLFTVSYRSESILNRYITAGEQELELVENSMSLTRQKKVIDSATGAELDRIGDLFGVLGDRGDRDDIEYRTFLKSIVKSFISRGTIDDIITALSAATDVPPEDITINEDFINNEYEVEILAQTAVRGSVIEDVTEIADPSGVDLSTTRFVIPTDEIQSEDIFNSTFGNQILDSIQNNDLVIINGNLVIASDDLLSSDVIASPRRDSIDDIDLDELILLDSNTFLNIDELLSEDVVASPRRDSIDDTDLDELVLLDDNKFINSDGLLSEDVTESTRRDTIDDFVLDESLIFNDKNVNSHRWEENREGAFNTEWGFFSWTELRDLIQQTIDVGSSDDKFSVGNKKIIDTDNSSITDQFSEGDLRKADTDNSSVTDQFTEGDKSIIQLNQNIIDKVDPDSSEKIVLNQNVRDVIDPDASSKITDVDNSIDLINNEVRDKNEQRWSEHRWNLFSWSEITSLGTFSSNDILETNDNFIIGNKNTITLNQNVRDVIKPDASNKIAEIDNSSDNISIEVRSNSQQRWSNHRWDLFAWT